MTINISCPLLIKVITLDDYIVGQLTTSSLHQTQCETQMMMLAIILSLSILMKMSQHMGRSVSCGFSIFHISRTNEAISPASGSIV